MAELVGKVTQSRYDELVAEAREIVEQLGRCQWRLGDMALEIEPIRPVGGRDPGDGEDLFTVARSLELFAEDIGLSYHTVQTYRWVSSRWPAAKRQFRVSHGIHKVLGSITDEKDRFATILDPPLHERSGTHRWTRDAAKRVLGWQVDAPESVQERVEKLHGLASDEAVAAVVATDSLRRLEVAFRAMADDTARFLVNRAQVERAQQAAEATHAAAAEAVDAPVPLVHQVQHTLQVVDLIGACSQFVAQVGRIVPAMRGQVFSEDERETVFRNLARLRGAADWVEAAITTGNASLDEGLAALLRGE